MIRNPSNIIEATTKILGFTDNEKAIMQALDVGPMNISAISRYSKIPRTSLLYILKKLEKRNLVAKEKISANNIIWRSNTPSAIGELRSSKITIYEGLPSLWSVFQKITALPKNTRLMGIQPDNSIKYVIKKIPLEDILKLNEGIKKKTLITEAVVHERSVDTITRELGSQGAKKVFKSFLGRLEDYAKIPDEFANVESEIYIFSGSVYLLNWNKEVGIGIHDKDMVALLTAMFSCVKEFGIRYSQNEKMGGRLGKINAK